MNVIIFGPPGAGKGTQAEMIVKKFNVVHIATGDILREAVARQTELGRKAREYMVKGELVPDEVVIGIVNEKLAEIGGKNFLLDGFPRTLAQAEALDRFLKEVNKKIDVVLNLEVDEEEIIRRLSNRRVCKTCGSIYHLTFNPPKFPGKCDKCGGELYQRDDDKEESIRNRLKVYKKQTKPLIDYYERKGLLKNIDGNKEIEEVAKNIENLLKKIVSD
ncbi:MAG: adenylate kinase [Candidatus Bathyarchaeota archaeon]|nr:adenylate kinase [Candidatus Bathyarchaeota archaeon]